MTDPTPKPPEEPEVDGWLRAALKRQRWWPSPKFTPVHKHPWHPVSYRMIALHIDQTTPGGLR